MSLKCAIDLGIPEIIQNHGKPMTITELVSVLPLLNPTKACDIHRLMRIVIHSGFFARQKLDNDAQEVLGTWFRNDDSTPFVTTYGKTAYDYCGHDPSGAFEGLGSLVDVGGGTGTVAKAIADAFPHLNCTVLDLPHVVHGLQGEGGKVMIVDIVVMDAEKVNEENSKTFETQLFMDMTMNMMALLTGRERREEEWAKLFFAAGFSDYKIIPILV
ncbi:hypothetical protein V6N11_044958 [Hibiscus sabdariffa]|uniref:O-methyltransferase domain-containing protein n=1 Tax=Hibiscus sabdariffa TaxID=183260 RepID=A0ABR2PUE0_9ROSI